MAKKCLHEKLAFLVRAFSLVKKADSSSHFFQDLNELSTFFPNYFSAILFRNIQVQSRTSRVSTDKHQKVPSTEFFNTETIFVQKLRHLGYVENFSVPETTETPKGRASKFSGTVRQKIDFLYPLHGLLKLRAQQMDSAYFELFSTCYQFPFICFVCGLRNAFYSFRKPHLTSF